MPAVTRATAIAPAHPGPLGFARLSDNNAVTWPVPFFATGPTGRFEGYSNHANAMRAARLLSRGAADAAVAVTAGKDGVHYVWKLDLNDRSSFGHGRTYDFRFENGLPARVGPHAILLNRPVEGRSGHLVAVVDGPGTLPVRR